MMMNEFPAYIPVDRKVREKINIFNDLSQIPGMNSEKGMSVRDIFHEVEKSPPDSLKKIKRIFLRLKLDITGDLYCNEKSLFDIPKSIFKFGHKLKSLKNCVVGGKKLTNSICRNTGIAYWKFVTLSKKSGDYLNEDVQ